MNNYEKINLQLNIKLTGIAYPFDNLQFNSPIENRKSQSTGIHK